MKTSSWFLLTWLIFLGTAQAASKPKPAKTITGTINDFESADNFYLTIVDPQGKRHTALCLADLCEEFMMAADENLGGYKGKKVRVTLGTGQQVDGSGQIMGAMEAFTQIELLK